MKKRSCSRTGRPSFATPAGRTFLASPRAGTPRRSAFDPSKTWRRRRCEEILLLSAMERRYLLDLLAQIEASGCALSDEIFISARRVAGTASRRSARSLCLLVERGVLELSGKDDKLRAFITQDGRQLIRRWFAAKPPDFIKRFPRLYRALGFCKGELDGASPERVDRRTEPRGQTARSWARRD